MSPKCTAEQTLECVLKLTNVRDDKRARTDPHPSICLTHAQSITR